ncbi:SNF5-domain-containing protein [Hymenopellis radicata]|nr:SNF5-domain-containing protein [Hymenopellis radicata]
MGGGGMGGGGMGPGMGGGMGGGGMPGSGMGGGMGNGGGMGMGGMGGGMNTPLPNMMNMNDGMSMQRPGTSMGGVTATSLGGSFGPQFGGGNPSGFGGGGQPPQQMPQQPLVPNAQQLNIILSLSGLSREQYVTLNPHDRQVVHERASQKYRERQRMQQEQQQMMHNMGGGMGGGTPQQPPQQFPGNFANDRPPSSASHPSMMPPPPPGVRPGTSMSMRRAPSMEHMRPPSAMGGFPKPSLPEQSPTGNVYPQPSPVSAHRMPGSPRMDSGFPPSSASAIGSPTRPVSSASNGPAFGKSGTPARMPSVSRAATATPTNMHSSSEPGPHHGTPASQPPLRSTPTPYSASTPPSAPPSAAPSTTTVAAPPPVIHKLPPLPNLNKAVTHITPVPLKDSLKLIPEISETEKEQVKDWMKVDKEYEKVYLQMRERMEKEHEAMGKRWWERGGGVSVGLHNILGPPRARFDVKYPGSRSRKETRGRSRPRTIDPQYANLPEELVPIRLEFDVDQHQKMRDTFVWNLNDPIVTPEVFAQSVIEDYKLSSSYLGHSVYYDGEGGDYIRDPHTITVQTGNLDRDSALWWKNWRKRVRKDFSCEDDQNPKRRRLGDEDRPMDLHELKLNERDLHEDMRILIRLDIIVGSMKLEDQFEWDLDNTEALPESFAEVYTNELGLGGEFRTAIAHAIREQIQTYQKSLFLVGHPSDGTPVQDDELRGAFLPSLSSATRPTDQVQAFTPLLNSLSDGEIERHEKERDKDMNKRKKRNTRGRRGVALPDRDAIRTYRTPAYGFPELDPAILALQAAANAPTSRRAAAAAASLTIANMVASENGQPLLTQAPTAAQPQPPPPPKEKKQKWLSKAPEFPKSVLRPRARVGAPTRSTAADATDITHSMDAPRSAVTAKRQKELEREAKEREYAEGQHDNFINGVWHCSNCGCPESIAVGRRKGPLGDKSQCGTCGKFWHRHRRPRPVEYNTNPEYHSRREVESTPVKPSKRKGAAASLRAQAASTPRSTPVSPRIKEDDDFEMPPSRMDNALSPVSTASSGSEPPLSHRVKTNGISQPPPKSPSPSNEKPPSPSPSGVLEPPKSPSSQRSWPPQWLATAMQAIQVRYPHDKFEVALRKLYKPGPGETLSNFEVHLRFNGHRRVVEKRVAGS